MATAKEMGFETTECGRCGGSGHYSFNLMYGTTCFGCNGTGWKLTKRGAAAKAFFQNSRPVTTAADLEAGQRVYSKSWNRWWTVDHTEGDPYNPGAVVVVYKVQGEEYSEHKRPESEFLIACGKELWAKLLAAAIEYQQTLTKAGKPRSKRRSVRTEEFKNKQSDCEFCGKPTPEKDLVGFGDTAYEICKACSVKAEKA
jgi:hypothetical protein